MKRISSFALSMFACLITTTSTLAVVAGFEEPKIPGKDNEESKTESEFSKNQYFAAPEMLMVEDVPLNSLAKKMYPSPELYDIDNDGANELIVGDIFGAINVYENSSSDRAKPKWEKHTPLKTSDGKNIKVSNW